jgi:hypothetical protein
MCCRISSAGCNTLQEKRYRASRAFLIWYDNENASKLGQPDPQGIAPP